MPILQENEHPFGMFQDLSQYPWVLPLLKYDTGENLIKVLEEAVIKPALEKAGELELIKAEAIKERHVNDYLPRE